MRTIAIDFGKGIGKLLADPKKLALTLVVGGQASTLLLGGREVNANGKAKWVKRAPK